MRGNKGGKGYLPSPDISLPSMLKVLPQCIINSYLPTGCSFYQHLASPVVTGSTQVHCCNSASSSKLELKHSCCLGTPSTYFTLHHPPGTGADWGFLLMHSSSTSTLHSKLVVPTPSPLHAHTHPTFPAWLSCISPHLAAPGAAQLFRTKDGEQGVW